MVRTNKKKLKHRLQKQKSLEKRIEKRKKSLETANVYNPNRLISYSANSLNMEDMHNLNQLRIRMIHQVLNRQFNSSSSRMYLNDYKGQVFGVIGVVSDIMIKDNHRQLLIDTPRNVSGKVLDSHLWIDIDKIVASSTPNPEISIGDVINFYGKVKEYRGTGDYGRRVTKFGFDEIWIAGCGQLVSLKNNIKLVSDYPRKGDYILKLNNVPILRDIENKLKIGKNNLDRFTPEGNIKDMEIEIKKSNYASFEQRVALSDGVNIGDDLLKIDLEKKKNNK